MATILVVDDSPVIRRLLGHVLQREGHTMITAADAYTALDLLRANHVDLVIADLAMPDMDGIALLQAIRADEHIRNVPLMMLTASGQDQDRLDAQAAGVGGFLTKPASSRDLITAVSHLLQQESGVRPALSAAEGSQASGASA